MISPDAVEKALGKLPKQDAGPKQNRGNGQALDVMGYLQKYGVEVIKTKQHKGNTLFCLKHCIFDESHNGNESAIGQTPEGKLFYQCFHDSCSGRTWVEARRSISGDDKIMEPPPDMQDAGKTTASIEKKRPAFGFVALSDLEAKPPLWLIKGIMEADMLAVLVGEYSTGKSFMAIDMACCVASGRDFHGQKVVKQGPVLFIAGEGHSGLKRRFMAWGIRNGVDVDALPIWVSRVAASLTDSEGAAAVADAIRAMEHPPVLIVIDTVQRNFGPGDENTTQDMSRFVQAADRSRAAADGATVLCAHHCGHGDKGRGRGSIVLPASCDAEYLLRKDDIGNILLEAKKMKDAPLPETMAFKLRAVDLPMVDEDGKTVTSAILDATKDRARMMADMLVELLDADQGDRFYAAWEIQKGKCAEHIRGELKAAFDGFTADKDIPSAIKRAKADGLISERTVKTGRTWRKNLVPNNGGTSETITPENAGKKTFQTKIQNNSEYITPENKERLKRNFSDAIDNNSKCLTPENNRPLRGGVEPFRRSTPPPGEPAPVAADEEATADMEEFEL